MKAAVIKKRLRRQRIVGKATTVRGAFASAVAPFEKFDRIKFSRWLEVLGQQEDEDLRCVYCGEKANHLDHLFSLIFDKKPSGFGHFIFNTVPACHDCNVNKGSKSWRDWLEERHGSNPAEIARRSKILSKVEAELLNDKSCKYDLAPVSTEIDSLIAIREEVLTLMRKADELAAAIHKRMRP